MSPLTYALDAWAAVIYSVSDNISIKGCSVNKVSLRVGSCLLMVLAGLFGGKFAEATQSLTLSSPQSQAYAGEPFALRVTGDNLRVVRLRVYRLRSAGAQSSNARALVLSREISAAKPRSQMTFRIMIPTPGWYQAEAAADGGGTASDDNTFTIIRRPPRRPRGPTLSFEGPSEINPPGQTRYEARGNLLPWALVRAWKLKPGGTQNLVYEARKAMPPRPPKKSKHYYDYDPVIAWQVPLLSPGVYLLETTSDRNLKQTRYIRVSDIGLVSKRAPHEILVYAIRLSTGTPLANTAVRLDDSGVYEERYVADRTVRVQIRAPGPSRAAKTASDGVARFYNTPGDGEFSISASAPDGSRLYNHQAYVQEAQNSDLKLLFYTERPIYRPGQTVYFKGVARRDLALAG